MDPEHRFALFFSFFQTNKRLFLPQHFLNSISEFLKGVIAVFFVFLNHQIKHGKCPVLPIFLVVKREQSAYNFTEKTIYNTFFFNYFESFEAINAPKQQPSIQ